MVATGPFQTPYVPKLAESSPTMSSRRTPSAIAVPDEVPQGTVLVVGGGNTGFQIAKELSATHKVVLSVGSRQKPLPQRVLGRDLFWWLTKARILDKTVESRLGRKLSDARHADRLEPTRAREALRSRGQAARRRRRRATRFASRTAASSRSTPSSGRPGYRADYSWIKLPIFDEDGRLRHRRGVTDVPGLYFLGLTWQHTRGSALIGWVKDDAEFIAERIAEYQESKARPAAETPVGAGRLPKLARPRGCSRCTSRAHEHHSQTIEFPRETEGLPEARKTELVELADGDEFELEIIPVKKRIGDATVRMLAYNGSVPGPTLEGPAGRDDHRARHATTAISTRRSTGTACGSRTATTARTTRRRRSRSARRSPTRCTCPTQAPSGTTRTSARTTARRWACTETSSPPRASPTTGRRPTASCCSRSTTS